MGTVHPAEVRTEEGPEDEASTARLAKVALEEQEREEGKNAAKAKEA